MKVINQIFQNRLFVLILILIISSILISNVEVGTWGINKTVGWAWDLIPINIFFFFYVTAISLLLYVALAFLKIKTNQKLLITQIILITSTVIFFNVFGVFIILLLNILSLVIFILNMLWTIRNRKHKIAQR